MWLIVIVVEASLGELLYLDRHMAFKVVAKDKDLSNGAMLSVTDGDTSVLLVRIEGTLYAYEDYCGHMGVPLSCGSLKNKVVTCGAHHWSYDLCTGLGVAPKSEYLKTYDVQVSQGDILIDFQSERIPEAFDPNPRSL